MSEYRDTGRGWPVVGAAFVGLLFSVGVLVVYSFGVLASAMGTDFGWKGLERSTLFLAFSVTLSIAGPLWGMAADRLGGRRVALGSSFLLALCFCLLAAAPDDRLTIHAIFVAIGLLGSGTLPPVYASVVIGWFDRHRGLALGVAMIGVGAGAAILPTVSAILIAQFGWRITCIAYALMIIFLSLPFASAFLRAPPEVARGKLAAANMVHQAMVPIFQDRRIWILALFAFLTGAVLVAAVTNFVPLLQSRGETLIQAARYQSILGLSLIVGRIITGSLIDRIFAPRVMMAILLVTATGFSILSHAASPGAYIVAAIGIGIAIGAEVDFLAYMVSRYYVRSRFTTIFALLFATYSIGGSIGPFLVGWLVLRWGEYGAILLSLAATSLFLGILILTLPRYDPNPHKTVRDGN